MCLWFFTVAHPTSWYHKFMGGRAYKMYFGTIYQLNYLSNTTVNERCYSNWSCFYCWLNWMTIFFQSAQKKNTPIEDWSLINREWIAKKNKFRKFVEQISSSSVCIPRCYSKYSMTMHIELKQLPISIDMNVFHQTASASSVMRCGKIERCWKISQQTETLYFFSFFVFFIRSTCCYISFFAICLISKRSIENE